MVDKVHSPSRAIDGNFIDISRMYPTAVDLAYVGSTKIKDRYNQKTEFVFYSFSNLLVLEISPQVGYLHGKKTKIRRSHSKVKYYNYYANSISQK